MSLKVAKAVDILMDWCAECGESSCMGCSLVRFAEYLDHSRFVIIGREEVPHYEKVPIKRV